MTIYDRPATSWRQPSPEVALMLLLVIAAALMVLPRRAALPAQQMAQASLRPGLIVTTTMRETAQRLLGVAGNLGSGAEHAAALEKQVEQLRADNQQLQAEINWLRSQSSRPGDTSDGVTPTQPLVRAKLIEARVLGRQAQSILSRSGLLDTGTQHGISTGDLVLDQGAMDGTAQGQLVISAGRVWGKVSQADARTSVVQRPTDAGFRELVRLASGARGILEGTGQPLCRLKLVEVTQAVSVGDIVLGDGSQGLIEGRLIYGSVERLDQPSGAAYWDIWVRPAATQDLPIRVAVLTGEVL